MKTVLCEIGLNIQGLFYRTGPNIMLTQFTAKICTQINKTKIGNTICYTTNKNAYFLQI